MAPALANADVPPVPLAVVMIARNEAHNMEAVLDNIAGWAREVFLVDSYSTDATVDIALKHGVHVVQRRFRGFGDQWNFALGALPITAPWTMKLDPDERLTPELKASIREAIAQDRYDALTVRRRLWFMGRPLPVRQKLIRLWRTGACTFSDVTVNEHPLVVGRIGTVRGDLEHLDSPDLAHWRRKQDRYSTAEALAAFRNAPLSVAPNLFGDALQRRMWLKNNFSRLPFRHALMFAYCLVAQGAWRAGGAGIAWARARADVYRMIDRKHKEMKSRGCCDEAPAERQGVPHPRAVQAE